MKDDDWKSSRTSRLEAHAKETRRRFHAKRPGLRPGDPFTENPRAMPVELWGAYHPRKGLTMLPWFWTKGIVEEWIAIEMPTLGGWADLNDGLWTITGPWRCST